MFDSCSRPGSLIISSASLGKADAVNGSEMPAVQMRQVRKDDVSG